MNAISPRIQQAFTLTDTQLGWVISAFMVGYFLTSPIFGALGDRFPRKGLIAAGVAVWSIATAMSGFAGLFLTLIAARIFVGVGEASYATLSPTIIDDLSDARSKNRMLAIFYAAIPVGSALGYVLGGQLEHAFGWRSAFYVAGAPGIVLAFLVLLIEEPPRSAVAKAKSHHTNFFGSLSALFASRGYRYAVLGYVAYTFALGAFAAWAPKYLDAHLAMPLKTADFWLGVILAGTGFAGTAVGGLLADRWPGEDRTRAALQVCAWSTALAAPFAVLTLLAGTPSLFFAAIGVTEFFLFVSTAPVNSALLGSVPSELRASAMACSIFAIHLFGDLVSPPAIGTISDAIRGPIAADGGASLRTAMFLLPAMIAVGAAFWAWGARAAPVAVAQPKAGR